MTHPILLFLVAEQHAALGDLKKILASERGVVITDEMSDPTQLVAEIDNVVAKVVTLCLRNADLGIACLMRLHARYPQLTVRALSESDQHEINSEFVPAHGNQTPTPVMNGRAVTSRHANMSVIWVPRQVLELFALRFFEVNAPVNTASVGLDKLTDREADIFQQLRSGRSNKEIARMLRISDNTVKTHLQNIFRKLHVHKRHQIALH